MENFLEKRRKRKKERKKELGERVICGKRTRRKEHQDSAEEEEERREERESTDSPEVPAEERRVLGKNRQTSRTEERRVLGKNRQTSRTVCFSNLPKLTMKEARRYFPVTIKVHAEWSSCLYQLSLVPARHSCTEDWAGLTNCVYMKETGGAKGLIGCPGRGARGC